MMRWIILALSLGTFVMSMIHSVFMLFGFFPVSASVLPPWLIGVLTIVSAVLALTGGFTAFNHNRVGSVFLMLAALLCIISPSEFWIYGSLYLIATVFCFFLPRRSDFVDDDEDYEDEEDEEDQLIDPRELSPRRREQAARLFSDPREKEKEVSIPKPSEEIFKLRKRTSKTCPTCGANAAIDHRYCPTCGSSLHIPPDSRAEELVAPESADRENLLSPEENPKSTDFETAPVREISDPTLHHSDPPILSPENLEAEDPAFALHEEILISAPHKVFVKPFKEKAVPMRPLNIDPDASYQEFSQYARRKKRRTRSLGHRIFGVLLLLMIVGGTTWFLLGLRKLPENKLPVRPVEEPVQPPPPPVKSDDVVAQPVASSGGALPPLTVRVRPERGRVMGTNVNLREDHSTASKSMTRLQANVHGEVLDTWEGVSGALSGLWYRIRTRDGKEGWVYGQYFMPIGEALPKGYTDALLKSFGSDRTEVIAGLGQPSQSKASSLSWRGLTITLSGDTVSRIQLSASGQELKNGVKAGMTQKDFLSIMGYPSQVLSGQWRYIESDGRGLGVQLNKDGSVKSITVGKL